MVSFFGRKEDVPETEPGSLDDPARRNDFIAARLNAGVSLSDIQKQLAALGVNMTYLDLRLLAADLKVNWRKQDPVEKAPPPKAAADLAEPAPAAAPAKVQVTVSKLVRPGTALSGDVVFSSGAKAEWFVTHDGRLGMNPTPDKLKLTQDDLIEFQEQLQEKLGGGR